jgi:hypothetical protein
MTYRCELVYRNTYETVALLIKFFASGLRADRKRQLFQSSYLYTNLKNSLGRYNKTPSYQKQLPDARTALSRT